MLVLVLGLAVVIVLVIVLVLLLALSERDCWLSIIRQSIDTLRSRSC